QLRIDLSAVMLAAAVRTSAHPTVQPRDGVRTSRDTTDAPATISNEALLLLAKGGVEAPFILAKGFDLRKWRLEIEVPYVLSGTNYQLVLFGDSGNLSPIFTIESDTP
ncbi:hypothetical protein FB451DRAFT_1207061, partial [Mycena latifolia]